MFIVENASLSRASGAEVADYLNGLVRKCFESDAYCVTYATVEAPWHTASDDDSSPTTMHSCGMQNDFTNFDFIATTEDAANSAGWHFSSLDDIGSLAQWNTAPIVPTSSYASLDCTDMLSGWNYTAPVALDFNSTSNYPVDNVEKKRKRPIESASGELDRRVSPKTSASTACSSLSPETAGSSSTVESPVIDASAKKALEKRFACPYYKNNPLKFRQVSRCMGVLYIALSKF